MAQQNVTYKPSTSKSNHKGHVQYYPVIMFYSKTISDSFYLNAAQPTRSKAWTVAKNYIKNLNL